MNSRPLLAQKSARQLSLSVLVAVVLIALGGGLLWASQQQLKHAQREHDSARSAAQALHQRYQKAQADEPTIRQTIARFDQLHQQGLIGAENRLDWANALRNIGQTRRLGKLEFSLAPQRELAKLDAAGQFASKASQMKLSLQLLHEGDLLRVLDDLRNISGAIVQPRKCSLSELAGAADQGNARLAAECELDWITVQAPAATANLKQP
ncbi:hypothetical protein GCM10027046_16590 [Uliginosibacterium flavum]|uniref:Uncharacterized protein n=1 Tax=Uliginosibacterium flavum TaxID=1396831 RepID=A0ABV2TP35_9RHOO